MENWHLRQLDFEWFYPSAVPPKFASLVQKQVLSGLTIKGYHTDRKIKLLIQQLYQLVCVSLNGAVVADGRDTAVNRTKGRAKLWDLLEPKWLIKCTGSESSGKVTRYQATPKLLSIQDVWTQDLLNPKKLMRNSRRLKSPTRDALVVIQTKIEGKDIEIRKAVSFAKFPEHASELQKAEDRIARINERNARFEWRLQRADGVLSEPSIRLRQVHVGKPGLGTRFYTSGRHSAQFLSKELRLQIQINGGAVCELDYSGMMPRLLYNHFCKMSGPLRPTSQDIYQADRVFPDTSQTPEGCLKYLDAKDGLRNLVKKATLICINCATRGEAHSAIGKHIIDCDGRQRDWNTLGLNMLKTGPDSQPIKELVNRIVAAHPHASQYFFRELGLELMSIESRIMFDILDIITEAGKPALGIHDAVLCLTEDRQFVREVMIDVYSKHMGFDPVIS